MTQGWLKSPLAIYSPLTIYFEEVDIELFMNDTDPDWRDHYAGMGAWEAFEQMTKWYTVGELMDIKKRYGNG